MVQTILRVLVGVLGVLGVAAGLRIWQAPEMFASQLGLAATGSLGEATLRADLGAFFGVAGGLALAGAVRNRSVFLLAPLLLIAVALLGRVLTVLLSGYTPEMGPPMAVEAVMVLLLGAGWRSFR